MSDPLLVAGATGTNGRELIRQASAAGHPVRALVRDPARAADLAGPTVELVQGDLADPASLDAAFAGCRSAFVAAAIHPDNEAWFDNFNAAARRAGGTHVVRLSGHAASEDSSAELLRTHARIDAALVASELPHTILRPNSFYQNLLGQAASIAAQGAFYLPLGDARQSCIDVRDIAAVALRALSEEGHAGKVYELTGPARLSYVEIAAQLGAALGREVSYVPVSREAADQSLIDAGLPPWLVGILGEYFATVAEGRYAETTDTVRALLGREPIPFATFATDFAEAFR